MIETFAQREGRPTNPVLPLLALSEHRTGSGQCRTFDPKRSSGLGTVAIATFKSAPLRKVQGCEREGQCVDLFVSLDWLWRGSSRRQRRPMVGVSPGSSRTPNLTERVRGSM